MAENDSLLQNLKHEDVAERKKAVFAVGEKKIKDAVPILIELLEKDPDSVIRNSAARSLGKIADKAQTDPVIEALNKALEDSDYYVKTNACWSLGKLKDPRAIPALMKMVDPKQRIYTMGGDAKKIKGESGSNASENLKQEGMQFSDIIVKAINAIGEIGDKEGLPALFTALGDEEDGTVRCASCLALGKIGDPIAVPVLIKALEDKYWYVRRDAAKALLKFKDPRAAPALVNKLNDMYNEVKEFSLKALLEIGKPAGLFIFQAYLKDTKNHLLQQFITKNLTKDDIKGYLAELLEKEEDPSKKTIFQAYLQKLSQ